MSERVYVSAPCFPEQLVLSMRLGIYCGHIFARFIKVVKNSVSDKTRFAKVFSYIIELRKTNLR